jgi:hypothetical protein
MCTRSSQIFIYDDDEWVHAYMMHTHNLSDEFDE